MAVCAKRKTAAFEIAGNIKIEREENKMELKVKEFTLPEVIEFNYDELKNEITTKAATYLNMVYTEDQIKEAKQDVAMLRKFTKVLSDERIRIKKEYLEAVEPFENKIKELCGIVEDSISNIDRQVKEVEEKKKAEKLETINAYFESCSHPEWLKFEQIFDSKWLNASVTLKKAQEEMVAKFEQIEANISTLQILPEFSFEAIEVYKDTLDINKAMQEGKRLADIQKRKAEQEAAKIKELETVKSLDGGVYVQDDDKQGFTYHEPATQEICFRCWLTTEDAKALAEFFRSRNIQYSKI